MAVPTPGFLVDKQSIYDGFYDKFTQFANSGIVYGTDAYPFADIPQSWKDAFGGPKSGISQGDPSNNAISSGNIIDDQGLKDYVIGQAVNYCRIRTVNTRRIVTASGGPAEGSEWANGVSNMTSANAAPGFSNPSSINNITQGNIIYSSQLNSFMSDCYNTYKAVARDVALQRQYSVCHNSCHSSCHGSRGRR